MVALKDHLSKKAASVPEVEQLKLAKIIAQLHIVVKIDHLFLIKADSLHSSHLWVHLGAGRSFFTNYS